MYEDVAASEAGKSLIVGALAGGGTLGGGALLPGTGINILEILLVAVAILGLGVAALRATKKREDSFASE